MPSQLGPCLSGAGSSPHRAEASVGEEERLGEVRGEIVGPAVGVGAARGRHDVRRPSAEQAILRSGHRRSVNCSSPSGQPDEADRSGLEPLNHPLDAFCSVSVFLRHQLRRPGARTLHHVGHADTVYFQRTTRIAAPS